MNAIRDNANINIYPVIPRTRDPEIHLRSLMDLAHWSNNHQYSGLLLFTGNDTPVDPWLAAQTVISQTDSLEPIIAVNPAYMHPFSAARMICSIATIHRRKINLNLIAGTAVGDLTALGDTTDHDDRYQRLEEYAAILLGLLTSRRPLNFDGRFYRVHRLQLTPPMPQDLIPGLFLAGQSKPAIALAKTYGAQRMRMLPSRLYQAPDIPAALHFGIICRHQRDEARRVAAKLFPEDFEGREILSVAMRNTDATWKHHLYAEASQRPDARPDKNGFWIYPFLSGKADCPYLVGSRSDIADIIVRLVNRGCTTLILDAPVIHDELQETAKVLDLARLKLNGCEGE